MTPRPRPEAVRRRARPRGRPPPQAADGQPPAQPALVLRHRPGGRRRASSSRSWRPARWAPEWPSTSITRGLDLNTMKPNLPGVNTIIYDRYGGKLAVVPSTENRTPVSGAHISPWLRKATVDIEDRRFYQHGGVDFQGIAARADRRRLRRPRRRRADRRSSSSSAQLLYLNDNQTVHPQDQGGLAGHPDGGRLVEAEDPQHVPERRPLRRRHLRLRGGGARLLLGALPRPEHPPGGDPGRPAAVAHRLQPEPAPAGGPSAPQRGAAGDVPGR